MVRAKPKSYDIAAGAVWEAYRRVKENRGAAGIDGQTFKDFEVNLEDNLYRIWNRMSSGSYFPPPVMQVEIPKGENQVRKLGIPTISDRIAQTVAKLYLEPIVKPKFHDDSYGYRPNRSAIDAVQKARVRCWRHLWTIDLDIKEFFDSIPHELMMKAVRFHTQIPWLILYIERWLKAPIGKREGQKVVRNQGTPQGSAISPILSNLFMHHAFDDWMRRTFPTIPFERYADDIVVHCRSKRQAEMILDNIHRRLKECRLELHPKKTKIVYGLNGKKTRNGEHIQFDFLSFTFKPRSAVTRQGRHFLGFLPGVSNKAVKKMRDTMRSWKLTTHRHGYDLNQLARLINPCVRGWLNYFGGFYRQKLRRVLDDVNRLLARWARKKYKRLKRSRHKAQMWLRAISKREPKLFYMWTLGIRP